MQAFVDRSTWLGLLLAAGPLAVLAHGTFDAGSFVTGLLMAVPTIALLLLGDWRAFTPTPCDALFGIFIACIVVSICWSGIGANAREWCLLILALAAYPAARLNGADFFPMQGFLIVAGVIVAAGTLATIPALLAQWSAQHGKPMVFDRFDAAPAQFATLLSFVLIVVANSNWLPRNVMLASLLGFLPVAVFAASMVRFTLFALVVTLVVGLVLSPRSRRWRSGMILVGVIAAITTGAFARHHMTATFASQITVAIEVEAAATGAEHHGTDPATDLQVACPQTDMDSSVAIRRQLYRDAFRLLPEAGLFGLGLNSFAALGCIAGTEVHNTFLQVAIEFGWIAGAALVLLMVAVGSVGIPKFARMSPAIRIALCGLTFVMLLTLAHGLISRDTALFVFIGYAAALKQQTTEIAAWIARITQSWNRQPSTSADAARAINQA